MKKVLTTLAILLLLAGGKAYAIPQIEREALIALYESTNGDNWSRNDGWKTPPLASDGFAMPGTECNWYGIDCTYMGLGLLNELRELSLSNNQLSGFIPPELGNLSFTCDFYEVFNLSNNQLSGSIPPELSNLSFSGDADRSIFDLSNNQLSGPIPPELGNLSLTAWRSEVFDLSNNQLTGAIPPELGNLGTLAYFILSNNQLSGSIPPELGNLNSVVYFNLSGNQLSGPIPLELGSNMSFNAWPAPPRLDLSNNQLSGPIPPELGNNSSLSEINLSSNQLTGPIPLELFTGYNPSSGWWRSFDLSHNLLIGPIQLDFDTEWNVWELNICNNYLYTDDNQTRDFLNGRQPGWEACQYALPEFSFTPASLSLPASAGSASVNVSNTGGGTLIWTATVTSGGDWLSLTSGSSGIDTGTVTYAYNLNSADQRIGTIRFESLTEQSHDFQVTQAAASHALTTSVNPSDSGAVTRSPNESTLTHNASVQLTAIPNPGYTFSHWSGDASGSSNPVTVTMDSNKSVTANFTALTYTLSAASSPSGGGNITRSPDKPNYNHNETVQLTAVPIPGFAFSHWSGGANGSVNPVSISMTSNTTVMANFTALNHTLSISLSGGGSVVRNPEKANYSHNESVQLTATPNPGYTFSHWSGDASGSSSPISITMDSNKSIAANFTAATYTLNTASNPGSSGSVTINPNKPSYNHNETVQLTAAPSPGYAFSHWSGGASGSSNPVSITMDSNKSVTAHFAADIATPTFTPDSGIHTGETVSVTVTCATPGVTIHYTTNGDEPTEFSPTVASGAAVSVPIPGTLKAKAWLGSDTSTTKTSAYTGPDNHALSLSILGRGFGSLTSQPAGISCHGTQGDSCIAYFNADSEVTLTANPEPGSAFKDWGADCAGQPGNTCTLIMGTDKIIEAHFLLKGQPNAIADYLSVVTLRPAERDFLLDIGDGTKPFPATSKIVEVRFQNDTAIIYYRDGTSQVVNVRHGDGYADDFINAVLLSDTPNHTFTTLLNLPSFDVELEYPDNFVVMCYPGITPVGSGPGIQISDLALLKLKPVGQPSIPFAYRVSAPVDGDFWITNHLQETVLPPTHTLTPGQVVDLYLTVDDNGLYDLDDTSNVIVDPLVLGQTLVTIQAQPESGDDGGGCFIGAMASVPRFP